MEGTDDRLWNNSDDGNVMLQVSVRKMKALTVKMKQLHRLVKLDRIKHDLCIKYMKSIVKYFFVADVLFLGGHLKCG